VNRFTEPATRVDIIRRRCADSAVFHRLAHQGTAAQHKWFAQGEPRFGIKRQ
jgi:hypothetical protein